MELDDPEAAVDRDDERVIEPDSRPEHAVDLLVVGITDSDDPQIPAEARAERLSFEAEDHVSAQPTYIACPSTL